ncbi:histidinol-phosphatase HisJ family protein [Pseudogracilibacillus auburnensis]|uniref:Histidinol-phosphatase n=1 Tax=Pseudogracilibacillus auburnensis TaxID=1494959 RepID=A0A2V3VXF1_9BACI|nr:histidinol-phosphatase (PHP family) [Pseudogracilibacillus auburnensis]
MLFDYHMHSNFSGDCSTPMEHTIQSAIRKGLKEICFTEHVDYDYPDPTIQFKPDLAGYDKEIKAMQAKYEGEISIKKGIEIGVQPHVLDRCEKLVLEENFDFIICSMHATDRKNLHHGEFFHNRSAEAAYQLYYEELLNCVQNYDQYSILGHLDLVKRYKKLNSNENFHEIIREIFQTIIPKGKGIEVNTSGFAYGLGSAMPSADILTLYKECGGEILTIGSDAHEAEHVAHRFKETLQLLESIGFEYITTFTNKEPTFHPIKQII